MNPKHTEEIKMRKEYDFSKAEPNPYYRKLRKQISIRIDMDKIEYFKKQAEETGITYQNLINLYLNDCAVNGNNQCIVSKNGAAKHRSKTELLCE
jgi:predicted DNA binding CopG/RHH family protein